MIQLQKQLKEVEEALARKVWNRLGHHPHVSTASRIVTVIPTTTTMRPISLSGILVLLKRLQAAQGGGD